MTTFTIEVRDEGVQNMLQTLQQRFGDLRPALMGIGSDMVNRVHRRFETSTAPDGTKWKPNAPATLAAFAGSLGSSYYTKAGGLNKSGAAAVSGKKPLIGKSGDLSRQIGMTATAFSVTLFATPVYAAIHQFGGQAGRGNKVKIPARPFMPVRQDGTLYPDEQQSVLDALQDFLTNGLG